VYSSLASIVIGDRMSYQQQRNTVNQTYRLLTHFTTFNPILPGEVQGVIKHQLGRFEAQSVLLLVGAVLGGFPCDFQVQAFIM
jgi:hypothetical protein